MEDKTLRRNSFSRIPMKEKIAYFVGECGSCGMFYYLSITLSTYFFTDVMHISAVTLGTVIIASRIFDGISDLIVGSLVDRTHTRWGKARPWVLFSTIPYAVAMVLLYCLPASFSTGHQIAYIVITYNLAVTVCYTVENIPWGSLPALMTRSKVQRSQMHSIRMLASPLGSAIGVSVAMPLISAFGGRQQDWIKVMTILAIVGIACNFFAVFTIKERVTEEKGINKKPSNSRKDIPSALHNPYWWAAIIITLVWNTFSVATATLTPYYMKYFLLNDQLTAMINNAQTITMALAAFSCYWLTKKFEKSTILKFTMVISIVGQILIILRPLSLGALTVGTVIRSVGFGCMGACMFAMARAVIKYGPIACAEPDNEIARENLSWVATLITGGIMDQGGTTDMILHLSEYGIAAYYEIPHGHGVAIMMPRWMQYVLNDITAPLFYHFGVVCMNIEEGLDVMEGAQKTIDAVSDWLFNKLGLESHLANMGVDEAMLPEMAKKVTEPHGGVLHGITDLTTKDIENIYRMCM